MRGIKCKGKQNANITIMVNDKTTIGNSMEQIGNSWVEWGKKNICDNVEFDWKPIEKDLELSITIYDDYIYYPSHSWYDPDDYDYGDYFVDEHGFLDGYVKPFFADKGLTLRDIAVVAIITDSVDDITPPDDNDY